MAAILSTNRSTCRKYSILAQVCFDAEWGRAYNGGQPNWCSMNMQFALNSVRFAPNFLHLAPKRTAFSTKTPCV